MVVPCKRTASNVTADPGVTTAVLDKLMRDLNRADTNAEKELREYYEEALTLLGMRQGSDFSQNIIDILSRNAFIDEQPPGLEALGKERAKFGYAPSARSFNSRFAMHHPLAGQNNPNFSNNPHQGIIGGPQSESRILDNPIVVDPALLNNLVDTVKATRDDSEELCSRVRVLDTTATRIQSTLHYLNELLQIRECAETVHASISNKDYEAAARSVAKYKQVLMQQPQPSGRSMSSTTKAPGGTMLPEGLASLLDESVMQKLEEARVKLSAIVNSEFEAAIKSKNQKEVARYAKLFYPLGLAESAVQTYLQFIRDTVKEQAQAGIQKLRRMNIGGVKAQQQPMPPYSDTLMTIFESVCQVLNENHSNIETEFGRENYSLFLKGIYAEAGAQQKKVLTLFKEQEYLKYLHHLQQRQSTQQLPAEKIQQILYAMQALSQTVETFSHFICQLIKDAHADKGDAEIRGLKDAIVFQAESTVAAQEMISHYVMLGRELLCIEAKKALNSDEVDEDVVDPSSSSMIDELFFVFDMAVENSMETCNIDAVCCMVNEVVHFVSKDYEGRGLFQAVQSSLRESHAAYKVYVSNPKHIQENDEDKHVLGGMYERIRLQGGEEKKVITSADSWPHAVNNAYRTMQYIDNLVAKIRNNFANKKDADGELLFPPENIQSEKKALFEQTLGQLSPLKEKYDQLTKQIVIQTVVQGQKPREPIRGIPRYSVNVLKHGLVQSLGSFEENSFNINEAQFQDWQVNDLWVLEFIRQLGLLHNHISRCYLPKATDAIMDALIEQTCNRVRSSIEKKHDGISFYGGLQIDQDVRQLQNYFLSITETVNVRKKFKRLTQITSLLALEDVKELKDFFGQQKWELPNSDIKRFLIQRFGENTVERDAPFLARH